MKKSLVTLALILSPLTVGMPVFAQEQAPPPAAEGDKQAPPTAEGQKHPAGPKRPEPTAEEKAQWDAMSPEQREAKMQERRAAHEAKMSPEQKAEHQARRKAWEAMSPEQREAKRKEMQQRPARRPQQQPRRR